MLTILRSALVLLLLSLSGLTPQTTPKQSSPKRSKGVCDEAVSQMEMNQCFGDRYHKADAHLNAVYRKVVDLMEKDLRDAVAKGDEDWKTHAETVILKLKTTEKVWIQYRDLNCNAAEFENEGGSIAPTTWAICMTHVTEHRIIDLNNAYGSSDRAIK